MLTALVLLLAVPAIDHAIKAALRRRLGSGSLRLGACGKLQLVTGRLWLLHLTRQGQVRHTWILWIAAGASLLFVSTVLASLQLPVALILGGSLSNALETALYGRVSDYVCLRFWPAFNLADLSLATGAIGAVAQILLNVGERL